MSSLSPPAAAFRRPSLLRPKPASQLAAYKAKKPSSPHFTRVSCKKPSSAAGVPPNDQTSPPATRRDLLISIGGLYGAASSLSPALADPIPVPDISKCHDAIEGKGQEHVQCCPPFTGQDINDFKLPSQKEPMRTRPAAHSVDEAYIEKYHNALAKMKALPDNDPRSFKQQADVHCAYCNGAYYQFGITPPTGLQVHASWLFFPFHRYYLYFFERILGSLIDDPTFALPFWNWDTLDGMKMPAIFADPNRNPPFDKIPNPLFDQLRNPAHLPDGRYPLVNLEWSSNDDADVDPAVQYENNRCTMYRQMVSGAKKRTLFFGQPLKAGEFSPPSVPGVTTSQGTLETTPHTNLHIWVGDPDQVYRENMGNFYSAGRDPLFYSHHANVDRMWDIWKTLGPKRTDFTDPDWLDAAFLFYDENRNLVRCKIRDCLDNEKLRTDYEVVDIPWKNSKWSPKKDRKKKGNAKIKRELTNLSEFPLVLNKAISVAVPRPRKNRSKAEKEDEEEVLVVEGVEIDRSQVIKFDVALNDDDDGAPAGARDTEFAGSFVNVPHRQKPGASKFKTGLVLGITDLLEDLGADGDDTVVVTLVPKVGEPTIGGLKIDYLAD